MLDAERSIADEVEAAIKAGSAEKHLETARRVTDLFLLSAEGCNVEQVELFSAVLQRLVKTIEIRALADVSARLALIEMSTQLASVAKAPAGVIGLLARNAEIAIAGPVLTESARLSEEDLVEIATTKSEPHLLAVSARWWLKEAVTDALLARQFLSVSRRVVTNPGARLTPSGFSMLLEQAHTDPDLAVETGIRVDLPNDLRHQLLRDATEAVREKLLKRAPPHLFEEIRNAIAAVTATVGREMAAVRDFGVARRFVAQLSQNGKLNERILHEFARQRKYEETVVALAELAGTTIDVVRPLMQSLRDDGVLVPCKVAGLSWETVSAVLDCRFASGTMGPHEVSRARAQFARLTADNARRMLRFWQVRATDAPPNLN